MIKWEKYWNTKPGTFHKTDYFRQVGKTIHGEPVSQSQFDCLISEILCQLNLKSDDTVLDLCCGNGVITNELASHCKQVVGIDFSKQLIEIANRDHRPDNVSYQCASVLELGFTTFPTIRFNKVVLYDALQYFRKSDLASILKRIISVSTEPRRILFGGVPHLQRKSKFYDTWKKRLLYQFRRITNKDLIGTWWTEDDFRRACEALTLNCTFHDQSEGMYNGHFRFDITIF